MSKLTGSEALQLAQLTATRTAIIEELAREDARREIARMRRTPRKPLRDLLLDQDGLAAIPDPVPLVDKWLFKDSLAWVSGPPGSGKSFVAVDLACCVGTGTAWHGHEVTQGAVLYIVAESPSGFKKRPPAWAAAHGVAVSGVSYLPCAVQITDRDDMAELAELCAEVKPALIIFDTQSRCAVGVEENQSAEMSVLVDALDTLRAATGACVLCVHHTPRTALNLRGSNAQEGAATTIIATAKDGPVVTVSAETLRGGKQKDVIAAQDMQLGLCPYAGSAALMVSPDAIGGKALSVLRLMGQEKWSQSGLVTASALSKSTVTRALAELRERALIGADTTGRYPLYEATPAGVALQ